jgi:hypothetical protein
MHPTFSIKEAVTFGWHKTKQHSWVLFQVVLTLFALQVAQALVGKVLEHEVIGVLATAALFIAQGVVGIGFIRITLKLAKGEHAEYADVVPPWRMVWHFAAASLLAGIMIFVGFVLLIVPGVYLALRFSMVRFAVLNGAGIMGSLKQSGKITHGVKWKLLGFFVVLGLLNIAGFLVFFVGLLVSIPVTALAYAHVYQKLHTHHHAHNA